MIAEDIERLRALCLAPEIYADWAPALSAALDEIERLTSLLDEVSEMRLADCNKIIRLESQVAAHEANLHALLPLMTRYPLLCQKLDELGIDPTRGTNEL